MPVPGLLAMTMAGMLSRRQMYMKVRKKEVRRSQDTHIFRENKSGHPQLQAQEVMGVPAFIFSSFIPTIKSPLSMA
jgi:hypothetical protein